MDLHQRIEALEFQNRRLKLIRTTLLVLVGGILLWQLGFSQTPNVYGQKKPNRLDADFGVLTVRELRLVDAKGTVRADLRNHDKGPMAGIAELRFFGANKKYLTFYLSSSDDGGYLAVYGPKGGSVARILTDGVIEGKDFKKD